MGELRLMTLREAAAQLGGGLCESSLRREIRKGRLTARNVAGRLLVTDADLCEMVERCRVGVGQSRQGCTSGRVKAESRSGSFSTDHSNSGLAAAQATARELKKPSQSTSPKSTERQLAPVIQIK
jgi:hypothetical protein